MTRLLDTANNKYVSSVTVLENLNILPGFFKIYNHTEIVFLFYG